jgi:hypothetical protein
MYTSFQKYQFLTCSTTCTGKITEISSITAKNHPSKTTHVLVFFWGHFSSLVKIILKQVKMAEIHHPPTPLSNTETHNQREPGVPNLDIKWSI